MILTLEVGPADSGQRLDRFIASAGRVPSRSKAKQLVKKGLVQVQGTAHPVPSTRVAQGQTITVIIPPPVPLEIVPEQVPFEILHEDSHLLVIDKPPGVVVHPGAGHFEGTLVHGLLHHCKDLSGIGGALRPGIVHRLDKDTSGVMLVAKDDRTHRGLAEQFRRGDVKKEYLALVRGVPARARGRIELSIGRHRVHRKKMAAQPDGTGRKALSTYEVLESFGTASLVKVAICTGRTHQIRVHMSAIGHPLLGDRLYGGPTRVRIRTGNRPIPRQMLHARRISFIHPRSKKEMVCRASVPEDMESLVEDLRA